MSARKHLSVAGLARELGVTRQAVTNWRARYGEDSDHPFPAPDVEIVVDVDDDQADGVPGWLPERIDEVRQWRTGLPGRGAGGGRPRLTTLEQLGANLIAASEEFDAERQRERDRRRHGRDNAS
ncbi:hypothetical protein [Saccharopolyspora sp. NPDC002376]